MQHHFETLSFRRLVRQEHGDEALGINIEVTQAFDEFGAVFLYVATVEGQSSPHSEVRKGRCVSL